MASEKKREWNRQQEERLKPAYVALMKAYPFTLDDLDGEIWRDVDGYDGDYQISNYGRAKSFKQGKIIILKPGYKSGYLWFSLSKDNHRKYCAVHRLVAQAFIPNPDGKPQINHIDGHPLNNYVCNLEWATGVENQQHAITTGLFAHKKGTECYQAKLTTELAQWILSVFKSGDKQFGARPLARQLGIDRAVIQNLVHGKTYRDIRKAGD